MEEQEHHNLVDVCACGSDGEAAIIIGLLREYGIEAHRDSDLPHSVYPVVSDATVYVHEDDAERAKALLAERRAAPPLDENALEEGDCQDGEDT